MPGRISIGTSGFSYDDWVGPFYPMGLKKHRWFDYYLQEFDALEVNASYYAWLSAKAVSSLVERAPRGFRFAVKLNKEVTHQKSDVDEGLRATIEQNRPFAEAGCLASQLAQFPNGFRPTDENWSRVEAIVEALDPLTLEFRHDHWQAPDSMARLANLGVSLCSVDQPRIEGLLEFDDTVIGPLAYARFHGRNAAMWYEHEKAWQRYDYLYSEAEVRELTASVRKMSEKAKETLVFFNNHYGAQAVTNARQMSEQLGRPIRERQPKLF
ncbi:MAG: DUF72 domain-containing protein [Armatimonadetes bacterium]|nr:DUF72 domain-containing protein [Armatimonadota bacterium]